MSSKPTVRVPSLEDYRRLYLKLWREPDTGGHWPIIFANLKFATFNLAVAAALAITAVILRVT